MVALLAGLFVAATAFMLARNATAFFRHEAGVSSAQMATMVGLTRLQADLQRAGFLSSPNIKSDPLLCGSMTGWRDGMKVLSSVTIAKGGSVAAHAADLALSTSPNNGLNPDSIVIGGSFHTTEQFSVRGIFVSGGGIDVFLQTDDGPMARTMAAAAQGATAAADMFISVREGGVDGGTVEQGRIVRLVDEEGRQSYAVASGFAWDSSTTARLSLTATPALPSKAAGSVCGYAGMGIGTLVNPVSRVRYDLRAVDPNVYPQYAGLFVKAGLADASDGAAIHVAADAAPRTELVRVELVSEYAVDLKFGLTLAEPPVSPGTTPTLHRYLFGDDNVYTVAGAPGAVGSTPERIRSVQIRLSVRAAASDRKQSITPLDDGGIPTARGIYSFDLGTDGHNNKRGFARVRALVADVALPNVAGANW
jgi:hypothetical protein